MFISGPLVNNNLQGEVAGAARCYLGVDVGGTKTRALITAQDGRALGWGVSGPGNHEQVGYEGLQQALHEAASQALAAAGIERSQIRGAGFGVAGYDWPSEREPTLQAVQALGLECPLEVVNDTLLGLLAGASQGWGVSVVAGTGCNCWGWDAARKRVGQVTGRSLLMGEAAGSSELVVKAMQAVAFEWTQRGPRTRLSQAFIAYTGAKSLGDLLEGYCEGYYPVDAAAAPLVFEVAAAGDPEAAAVIDWAGRELGELAKAVIRQLEFEALNFEVVQMGSMFAGSPRLGQTMQATIQALAPGARLVQLETAPVAGAVLLGMEAAGEPIPSLLRQAVRQSAAQRG